MICALKELNAISESVSCKTSECSTCSWYMKNEEVLRLRERRNAIKHSKYCTKKFVYTDMDDE